MPRNVRLSAADPQPRIVSGGGGVAAVAGGDLLKWTKVGRGV
jgi:hypothetical protein